MKIIQRVVQSFLDINSMQSFVAQMNEMDMTFAEQVKARIEKTTLKDVAKCIEEVYFHYDHFLVIKLDIEKIKLLQLEVDVNTISYV